MTDKAGIIRALFAAYMASDRTAVEKAFTANFRFTSPLDDRIDMATYFERCWPASISGWLKHQDIERIVVDGDAAFVTYRCITKDEKAFATPSFSPSMATASAASTSISAPPIAMGCSRSSRPRRSSVTTHASRTGLWHYLQNNSSGDVCAVDLHSSCG